MCRFSCSESGSGLTDRVYRYEELLPVRLTKRASGEVRPVFY